MTMHLFSTPIECTHCGTVVADSMTDRCPNCQQLLRERRTPSRLAGVERRYSNLRALLGVLRFLAFVTAGVGLLVFFASGDEVSLLARALILLSTVVAAAAILAVAALFDVALDLEENTRSSFRLQQKMLQRLGPESDHPLSEPRR